MPLTGITLSWYELIVTIVVIPTAITVPLTVFLIKLKAKSEQHDRCITRLENKIDELKDDIKDLKNFFVDWIQRLEDVTRDKRVDDRVAFISKKMEDIEQNKERFMVESIIPKPYSQQEQDKKQNSIEAKIDELTKKLDSLLKEKKEKANG